MKSRKIPGQINIPVRPLPASSKFLKNPLAAYVPMNCGELYYLRIMLNHVAGPMKFKDLRTVNKVVHPDFKGLRTKRSLNIFKKTKKVRTISIIPKKSFVVLYASYEALFSLIQNV